MNAQTIHLVIGVGLAIALGSAMPDRSVYVFPRDIGLYLFDWFYRTVKIITFNLAKEAEKKGLKLEDLPPNTTVTTPPVKPPLPPPTP